MEGGTIQSNKPTKKAAFRQITMAILANITILSSGMGIGFPAITLQILQDKNDPMALNEDQASWFASITAITCPFGGLLAGYLLDKIGRKRSLIVINVVSIISWGILSFANDTDQSRLYIEILIARVIIGIGIGLSSSPAAVYSAEICHPSLRGRLTLLTALATAGGMLVVYTLGYIIPTNWRLVSALCGVFTIGQLFLLIPIPESPSWLIQKGRMSEAEKAMRVIRGIPKSEATSTALMTELNSLAYNYSPSQNNLRENKAAQMLRRPEAYKPLAIMITFFFFQQFGGVFVVMIYAARFATEAKVAIDPFLCTVLVGVTRVCTTILMGFISDKFGRKPPATFSGIGMATCMFGLALTTWYPTEGTSYDWLPAVFVLGFIFSATLGFLTLPFAMIAEMFPQRIRGVASGITIFAGYAMSFVTIKLYPYVVDYLGNEFVFLFFGTISLLGILFVRFILIETKGKSLQEIEEHFKGKIVTTEDVEEQEKIMK